jgi:hypothetical protein
MLPETFLRYVDAGGVSFPIPLIEEFGETERGAPPGSPKQQPIED